MSDTDMVIKKSGRWKFLLKKHSAQALDAAEKFISTGTAPEGWVRLKSASTSEVWKFTAGDRYYLFKDFLYRGPFDRFKAIFRGSRARKSWQNGRMLISKGFNTPEPLILGEKTFIFYPLRSFMITEFLEGTSGFHTFLKDRLEAPLSGREFAFKRSLLLTLGKLIGRLHAEGIAHGDLRPNNILVRSNGRDSAVFYLIDNERTEYFRRGVPLGLRLKNLVQLNMVMLPQITVTDRARLFNAYLDENPGFVPVKKKIFHEVTVKTRSRMAKYKMVFLSGIKSRKLE